VVKHWHRLPREVADIPPLQTFKARLDGALSNLIELKMSLLTAGGLDQMAFKGRFQAKAFYDSRMILHLCKLLGDQHLRSRFPACRNGAQQWKKPQFAGHESDMFPD